MKRSFYFIVICLLTIVFVNCGHKSTPTSVAEEAVKCLQKKDFKGYAGYLNLPNEYLEQKDSIIEVIGIFLNKQIGDILDLKGGIIDYEIQEETIDEESGTAIVPVLYIYGNGDKYTNKFALVKDSKGEWKLNYGD